jgi:hypothetical protein
MKRACALRSPTPLVFDPLDDVLHRRMVTTFAAHRMQALGTLDRMNLSIPEVTKYLEEILMDEWWSKTNSPIESGISNDDAEKSQMRLLLRSHWLASLTPEELQQEVKESALDMYGNHPNVFPKEQRFQKVQNVLSAGFVIPS